MRNGESSGGKSPSEYEEIDIFSLKLLYIITDKNEHAENKDEDDFIEADESEKKHPSKAIRVHRGCIGLRLWRIG